MGAPGENCCVPRRNSCVESMHQDLFIPFCSPKDHFVQGLLTSLIEPEETPLSTNSSRDEPLHGHSSFKSIVIPWDGHKPRAISSRTPAVIHAGSLLLKVKLGKGLSYFNCLLGSKSQSHILHILQLSICL